MKTRLLHRECDQITLFIMKIVLWEYSSSTNHALIYICQQDYTSICIYSSSHNYKLTSLLNINLLCAVDCWIWMLTSSIHEILNKQIHHWTQDISMFYLPFPLCPHPWLDPWLVSPWSHLSSVNECRSKYGLCWSTTRALPFTSRRLKQSLVISFLLPDLWASKPIKWHSGGLHLS